MGRKKISTDIIDDDVLLKKFEEEESKRKNFCLCDIKPLNETQKNVFSDYERYNLLLYGNAGTGKTFVSVYLSLRDIFDGKYKKLVIVRSIVPSRDIGFLPGDIHEKIEIYKQPYVDICSCLFNDRQDAYNKLEKRGAIEFLTTSFIRGINISDSIILLDEIQNYTDGEIYSILTRVGKNSKVIICGDHLQDDLLTLGKKNQETGFRKLLSCAETMCSDFSIIKFSIKDVVRSGFVRRYLETRMNLGFDK